MADPKIAIEQIARLKNQLFDCSLMTIVPAIHHCRILNFYL